MKQDNWYFFRVFTSFLDHCAPGHCAVGAELSERPSARITHHPTPDAATFAALPDFSRWQSLSWEKPYLQCGNIEIAWV